MEQELKNEIEIHGGNALRGTVRISGAKNEVTKLMVASTLLSRPLHLSNVPHMGDVEVTADLLKGIGAKIDYSKQEGTMRIDATTLNHFEAIYHSTRGNRLSVLLAGPLLHHFGKAVVQKPGGCRIGERPLDLHMYYLQQMGVTIEEDDQLIELKGKLRAATIEFPYKSVGATEGALLASIFATGETVIHNPAKEPEIIELIKVMQRAGALIWYDAAENIHIEGTDKPLAVEHPVRIMGDRVEAISYACAAIATKGEIRLEGIEQHQIITPLTALRKIGANIEFDGKAITVSQNGRLQPLHLETDPHPAFATDYQQIFAVVLSLAHGSSYIHETVHDKRFVYLEQLNRLGGKFKVSTNCVPFLTCRFSELHEHTAHISGPVEYHGGNADITDLRAAFALVLAGLLSKQPTYLAEAHHLLRGYDRPIDKLQNLGASLRLQ